MSNINVADINEIDFALVRASITDSGQLNALQIANRLAHGAEKLAHFFNSAPGVYLPIGPAERTVIEFFCTNGIRAKFADFKKANQ